VRHLEGIEGADEDADPSREAGVAELLGKAPEVEGAQASVLDLSVHALEGVVEEAAEVEEVAQLGLAEVGQGIEGVEYPIEAAGYAAQRRRGEPG